MEDFLKTASAGKEGFMDFLTTGLVELSKAKPRKEEAAKWLGDWLIANNPNQPLIEEPEEKEN